MSSASCCWCQFYVQVGRCQFCVVCFLLCADGAPLLFHFFLWILGYWKSKWRWSSPLQIIRFSCLSKNSSDAEFCETGQRTLYVTETFNCTFRTCFYSYAYFLDAQDALDFEWNYWIEWGREYILWLLAGHLLVSQTCRLFVDKVCTGLLHGKFVCSN